MTLFEKHVIVLFPPFLLMSLNNGEALTVLYIAYAH